MCFIFCSLYHFFKDLYPASDYTTGYMSGGEWSTGAGAFTEHGNHTQPNTCSQAL